MEAMLPLFLLLAVTALLGIFIHLDEVGCKKKLTLKGLIEVYNMLIGPTAPDLVIDVEDSIKKVPHFVAAILPMKYLVREKDVRYSLSTFCDYMSIPF